MAWLVGDSFDFWSNLPNMGLPGTSWATVTTGTFSSSTRFGVGQSLASDGGGNINVVTKTFTNSTTVFINFAWMSTTAFTAGGTTQRAGFTLLESGTAQVSFAIRSGGDMVLTSSTLGAGSILATSSAQTIISASVWNQYQVKIVISNTVGSVEVRLNGDTSPVWTATGLNTRNGTANSYCNSLRLGNAIAVNSQFDDFYIFNDQGAAPNNWEGDVRALQLMPVSDATVTWTPKTGVDNWAMVDELVNDGDTTYVSTDTPGHQDYYGVHTLTVSPFNIVAVQTKMITRMDDTGPHQVCFNVKSGTVVTPSSTLSVSSTYTWIELVNSTDPNTGSAWTPTAVNTCQIGPLDVL